MVLSKFEKPFLHEGWEIKKKTILRIVFLAGSVNATAFMPAFFTAPLDDPNGYKYGGLKKLRHIQFFVGSSTGNTLITSS